MTFFSALRGLFSSPYDDKAAHGLYVSLVKQARMPVFYERLEVPDTTDGRFELVALHTFLALRRLRRDHAQSEDLAQTLFDLMFADMDQNLRELSIGDTGIAKRIKKMGERFYGRIAAYDAALDVIDDADASLIAALDRNFYRDVMPNSESVTMMAAYMRRESIALESQSIDALLSGIITFGAAPHGPEA